MADGRDYIEEAYRSISAISEGMGAQKEAYPEGAFADFEAGVAGSLKWAKVCRGKVWLRTGEGTAMASSCLDTANELKANLGEPSAAAESALTLTSQLEALARVLASKAQVIT